MSYSSPLSPGDRPWRVRGAPSLPPRLTTSRSEIWSVSEGRQEEGLGEAGLGEAAVRHGPCRRQHRATRLPQWSKSRCPLLQIEAAAALSPGDMRGWGAGVGPPPSGLSGHFSLGRAVVGSRNSSLPALFWRLAPSEKSNRLFKVPAFSSKEKLPIRPTFQLSSMKRRHISALQSRATAVVKHQGSVASGTAYAAAGSGLGQRLTGRRSDGSGLTAKEHRRGHQHRVVQVRDQLAQVRFRAPFVCATATTPRSLLMTLARADLEIDLGHRLDIATSFGHSPARTSSANRRYICLPCQSMSPPSFVSLDRRTAIAPRSEDGCGATQLHHRYRSASENPADGRFTSLPAASTASWEPPVCAAMPQRTLRANPVRRARRGE
jgi:hypothetical protein